MLYVIQADAPSQVHTATPLHTTSVQEALKKESTHGKRVLT